MWDVTAYNIHDGCLPPISTHTSRVGCDDLCISIDLCISNFYSHIPCGMWLKVRWIYYRPVMISTHTSRVGCDIDGVGLIVGDMNFYSHIPCGMWRGKYVQMIQTGNFYSHIPCGMWRYISPIQPFSHLFLLTHPVWDVTAIYSIFQSHYSHILQDGPIIHLELY